MVTNLQLYTQIILLIIINYIVDKFINYPFLQFTHVNRKFIRFMMMVMMIIIIIIMIMIILIIILITIIQKKIIIITTTVIIIIIIMIIIIVIKVNIFMDLGYTYSCKRLTRQNTKIDRSKEF